MAEPLYYYSLDGTDALGPVRAEELRRLARGGMLRAGSLICAEGESEWRPFDLATLPAPAQKSAVRPRKPKVSDDDAQEPEGIVPQILNVVTALAAGGAVVVSLTLLGNHAQEQGTELNGWYVLGGSILVFGAAPWCLSLFFKGMTRVIARTILALLFAFALPPAAYFLGLVTITTSGGR